MAGKKHVVYKGYANERSLTKKDLEGLGVTDASAMKFLRGEPQEVDAATAKILVEHQSLNGDFEESDQPEPDAEVSTDKTTTTNSPAKK